MYGEAGNHIYVRNYPLGFGVVAVGGAHVFSRGLEMRAS